MSESIEQFGKGKSRDDIVRIAAEKGIEIKTEGESAYPPEAHGAIEQIRKAASDLGLDEDEAVRKYNETGETPEGMVN